METTTSFCVSSSLPASALLEPLKTNRSWTIGCKAGIAGRGRKKVCKTSLPTEEITAYAVCVACIPLTVRDSFPAAGHDAVTQLDDLRDADYLLGVVTLVRQQHQEEKDVGNDGL